MQTQTIDASNETTPLCLTKILVAIDFSPASKKLLDHAFQLARLFNSDVTITHVFEPFPDPDFPELVPAAHFAAKEFAQAEKTLRDLVASVQGVRGTQTKWKLRAGVAAHEIVEAAKELDVDLVVIAAHGFTGWKHFCIGRTAERVVRPLPALCSWFGRRNINSVNQTRNP